MPYTQKIIKFASDYVSEQVTEDLQTSILNKIFMELEVIFDKDKKEDINSPFLDNCFEQMAHRILTKGRI